MTPFIDARIPVVFGNVDLAGADDALLLDGEQARSPAPGIPAEPLARRSATSHAADCACCLPRSAVGRQLSALFMARARGEVGFFRRVVVVATNPEAQAAVREAVAHDPLASSCFRMSAAA